MEDAWQSQDMAPSNGGISVPTRDPLSTNTGGGAPPSGGDNNTSSGGQGNGYTNGGGRSPPLRNGGDPPRRSSRSRSPGRRDRDGDRNRCGRREPVNSNPGNNLHVSGLHHKVDTRELEAAFAKVGRVNKASVMYDPHTRESRGFGFVTMESTEEADAAIVLLNSTELMGKFMTVETARRARARTPTPGRYYGPPKRYEFERPYNPCPYDSRYSQDYDDRRDSRRGGSGGSGGGRYGDYRRDDYRRDDYWDRDRGDRYRDDRRYGDRRY